MRAVIVAGGQLEISGRWKELLSSADLVVAADSGADYLLAMGMVPNVFTGDLDSLSGDGLRRLDQAGCELIVHPVEKDETDMELALRLAVERGAREIDILGALGGPRFDHALANVLLLCSPFLEGVRVRILDKRHEVLVVGDGDQVAIEGRVGDLLSLLPLTPEVTGVDTSGLYYALNGGSLHLGPARGVSNVLTHHRATVRVGQGKLLVIKYDNGEFGEERS